MVSERETATHREPKRAMTPFFGRISFLDSDRCSTYEPPPVRLVVLCALPCFFDTRQMSLHVGLCGWSGEEPRHIAIIERDILEFFFGPHA